MLDNCHIALNPISTLMIIWNSIGIVYHDIQAWRVEKYQMNRVVYKGPTIHGGIKFHSPLDRWHTSISKSHVHLGQYLSTSTQWLNLNYIPPIVIPLSGLNQINDRNISDYNRNLVIDLCYKQSLRSIACLRYWGVLLHR